MKKIETKIKGVFIIEPDVFIDKRGYFFESYQTEKYKNIGIDDEFVQDNQSLSSFGTVRGLHFQIGDFAQTKLVRVVSGKVLDVAVDIRPESKTFGKHIAEELSDQNFKQLYIPAGFAHGFSVLSEVAIFLYKCTNFYSKDHERGILYSDPELSIDWKVEKPTVSENDLNNSAFFEIRKQILMGT